MSIGDEFRARPLVYIFLITMSLTTLILFGALGAIAMRGQLSVAATPGPVIGQAFEVEVLEQERLDEPTKANVAESLLLKGDYTAPLVEQALKERYEQLRILDGYRFGKNGNPNQILIYAFNSPFHATSGGGCWVGMLSWSHGRSVDIRIQEEHFQPLSEKVLALGRSEDALSIIYREAAIAQREAHAQAERLVPLYAHNGLRPRDVFQVTTQTYLLSSGPGYLLEGKDATEVLSKAKIVEPGMMLFIVAAMPEPGKLHNWYYVQVYNLQSELLGVGWINGFSFFAQELEDFKPRQKQQWARMDELWDQARSTIAQRYRLTPEQVDTVLSAYSFRWPSH